MTDVDDVWSRHRLGPVLADLDTSRRGNPFTGRIEVNSIRGIELGFTSARFVPRVSYLWEYGDAIYISAIWSKAKGSLRALAEMILSIGKAVKIPTPMPEMLGIVQRAGYERTFEADEDFAGGEPVEIWVMRPKERP